MQGSAAGSQTLRQRLCALALAAALPAALAACAGGDETKPSATEGSTWNASAEDGESRAGAFLAGRFAQDHADSAAASRYLLLALKADPENVDLLQRTLQALAADGNLPEASQIAKRLLKYDGEAALAAMLLAEQDAQAGNWTTAEARVSGLPKRGLSTVMVPLITAWSRMGQGRIDGALEVLQPLSQTSNYAPLHDFHSALINDLADRRKAADQDYRSTLSGNARMALRSVEAATAFYRRTGQMDKANELLKRYGEEHPETAGVLSATAPGRLIDSPRAGLAEAYFSGAVTLRQGGAADLALIFGRMALDLQPNVPSCQAMVADLLQSMGRLAEANAIFAKIEPSAAVFRTAQLRIATNLEAMGDVDGSVKAMEALVAQDPSRTDVLLTLGDVLRAHQRWSEAANAYGRAIALQPKPTREQWSLYYSRGIALERAGQWTAAESDFLKALELEPNEPHVLNYLGYSWIDKGMNLDQGQKMIEKAVAQLPTDGDIVDSLGWAFYRTGNYNRAVETLQRAVELHPEEATINDHLGDALWLTGRQEEARFQWRRALSFTPEPDEKADLEKKLKSGLKPPVPLKAAPAK